GLHTFAAILAASMLTAIQVALIWVIASVGILFSEGFTVRSWMFHVANGAVSAFLSAQLFPGFMDEPAPLSEPFYVLAAGFAGRLVFWSVAGWAAGFGKPLLGPPRAPQLPPPA